MRIPFSRAILLGLSLPAAAWANYATSTDFELTKVLLNGSGRAKMTHENYELGIAVGEPAAGRVHAGANDHVLVSGYLGGPFGAAAGFRLTDSRIVAPNPAFYQDHLRVGVPFGASIELDFSDEIDPGTIASGAFVLAAVDRLGRVRMTPAPVVSSYDADRQRVILRPEAAWEGNTLYEVRVTPELLNVDGFTHEGEARIRFLTLLNPAEENIVVHPLSPTASLPASGALAADPASGLTVRLPAQTLEEPAMILFNDDPQARPTAVDPEALREATRKSERGGGPYRVPVRVQELNAFSAAGDRLPQLAQPVEISLAYEEKDGFVAGLAAPVRASTLSLWALDEEHRLWLKMPDSRHGADSTVSAVVPHFSAYALMGGPSGSTAEVYAFPVPWRPHGPHAGPGPGQTGTAEGGITFANLPSECVIRIYTISGDRVRELRHSDAGGLIARERWDVRTDGSEPVASGVYLWRVESGVDAKNGKLMVIR